MSPHTLRLGLAIAAALLAACNGGVRATPAPSADSASPETAPGGRVVFITARGEVPISVEVADTPATQRRGLMFRHELGADRGMLFVFDDEVDRPFWMKNTYIPLDIIFVSSRLEVAGVIAGAAPLSETSLTVAKPSRYVVEVNSGFSARNAITAGTMMRLDLDASRR